MQGRYRIRFFCPAWISFFYLGDSDVFTTSDFGSALTSVAFTDASSLFFVEHDDLVEHDDFDLFAQQEAEDLPTHFPSLPHATAEFVNPNINAATANDATKAFIGNSFRNCETSVDFLL